MKPVFFEAQNKEGTINEQVISTESLGRAFGPLQKQAWFSNPVKSLLLVF